MGTWCVPVVLSVYIRREQGMVPVLVAKRGEGGRGARFLHVEGRVGVKVFVAGMIGIGMERGWVWCGVVGMSTNYLPTRWNWNWIGRGTHFHCTAHTCTPTQRARASMYGCTVHAFHPFHFSLDSRGRHLIQHALCAPDLALPLLHDGGGLADGDGERLEGRLGAVVVVFAAQHVDVQRGARGLGEGLQAVGDHFWGTWLALYPMPSRTSCYFYFSDMREEQRERGRERGKLPTGAQVANLLPPQAQVGDAVRPIAQVDDGAAESLVEGRVGGPETREAL